MRLLALSIGVGLAGLGVAACGELLTIDEAPGEDAAAGDAATDASVGPGIDDGGAEGATADADADAPADADRGPPAPNPGVVTCGGGVCPSDAGPACCVTVANAVCTETNPPEECPGVHLGCDETADCPANFSCELARRPNGSRRAECISFSTTNTVEMCKGPSGCVGAEKECLLCIEDAGAFYTCGGKCPP